MNQATSTRQFAAIAARLEGDLLVDDLTRTIYSTDASEYQERPLAVAIPKTEADIRTLVQYAAEHRIGLIPAPQARRWPGKWWGVESSSMRAAI